MEKYEGKEKNEIWIKTVMMMNAIGSGINLGILIMMARRCHQNHRILENVEKNPHLQRTNLANKEKKRPTESAGSSQQ